ncbi:glycosyltransferase [Saccharibacter sp. 17.LH.SD]|uniref:bacteriohopanetetrol glucosamine biosynthesis glycosyltransferase HpnI n=1 Tax=Saccharibacter sp. 17.LH.SD TaxID=2689393 RepID=UPI00136EC536|nr:bacteriohopanetetrol glucosamine biosynthesis glycosyltransferase HpnI [Saccharibacter sp. 17.LH.SD]MXV43808.1 glycosyltransferase [Saccharibacter sp. 17.LH.SD]
MPALTTLAAAVSGLLSIAGHIQGIIGVTLLSRFRRMERETASSSHDASPQTSPPVSVLKPLAGEEPLLEEAIESFFQQDYPNYELIFGVQHPHDKALPIIDRLRARFPERPVSVVIDTTNHGPNRKVSNLVNMQSVCQHDLFVIADSDIHVQPSYLRRIVATLLKPDVQLVTTLYAGLPADRRLVRQLGAYSINSNFLPGVMMSRLLGRQDCLGATMALTKKNLERIGGFHALVNYLADDSELGKRIVRQGGTIALAPTLCLTTVAEETLGELLAHEIRWGRTVRSIEPLGYALSSLQLPLVWATLSVILSPKSRKAWLLLIGGWLVRSLTTRHISRLTKCPLPSISPYILLRDWLSAAVMIASARGSRVAWRGRTVHINRNKTQSASRRRTPRAADDPSSPSVHGHGVDTSDINRSSVRS